MSSIKVVNVNKEAPLQELTPVIEETTKEETVPVVEESKEEITNNIVEEVKHTAPVAQQSFANNSEALNAEAKVKAQETNEMSSGVKAQDRLITCPKCNKTMKTKSFRYNHEKICQGNLTDRPVKPKAKPKEKPKPEAINEPLQEAVPKQPNEVMSQQRIQQPIQHTNPLMEHYQRLQQEHIRQKQERFKNLFQGMISGSRKKR